MMKKVIWKWKHFGKGRYSNRIFLIINILQRNLHLGKTLKNSRIGRISFHSTRNLSINPKMIIPKIHIYSVNSIFPIFVRFSEISGKSGPTWTKIDIFRESDKVLFLTISLCEGSWQNISNSNKSWNILFPRCLSWYLFCQKDSH